MLAHTVRSGLIESFHRGSAIAVEDSGEVLLSWGDPDRPIFLRSAIKPFQSLVSVQQKVELAPEELALGCASHDGFPLHVTMAESILHRFGLSTKDLKTPAVWPTPPAERVWRGQGVSTPRPIFHGCSGKHAMWLATSVAAGWDHSRYLDPNGSLQQQVQSIVETATETRTTPVGTDGCGAPTMRGSVRGLALAFAKLSADPVYSAPANVIQRFPAIVGGNDRNDSKIAKWFGGPLKCGAQGLIGAGRHGIGIAVRSEDGSAMAAQVGIIAVMSAVGLLSDAALAALEPISHPPVLGGVKQVGNVQPALKS